jgi:hypothetical protein
MNRGVRLSAFNLALGYVVFGIVALVCFAAPLWYMWQFTINDGRAEIMHEDAERLADVFRRTGAQGLTAFIQARVELNIANERMLLFTDASHRRLAGNLGEWPRGIPDEPGTYTSTVDFRNRRSRAVFAHVTLPGGYNLLVGSGTACRQRWQFLPSSAPSARC